MSIVYIVYHSYELPTGEDETKFIGVFSNELNAQNAIGLLQTKPGFKDLPDHFTIDQCEIDQVDWNEGFTTDSYMPTWSVWREDDNGNTFLVSSSHTETEALRVVREFEQKGHKQRYWAKENL